MFFRAFLPILISILVTGPSRAQWKPPTPVVVATTVEKSSIQEGLKIPGSFVAVEDVTIRAKTEGEVLEIVFEDGVMVKKGDLLFRLRDTEKKALLQKARAEVKLCKTQLARSRELNSRDFLSQAELDKIEAETAQAQAQLAIAKEGIQKTRITAPFDGVLSSRKVSAGAYLKNYDPLVRLQTLAPVRFEFQIPAKKLTLIQDNQFVNVSTDAFPGQSFRGRVVVIEPRADEKTRNVRVVAEFANKGAQLIPGMFGSLSVMTTDKHEALVVPEEALVVRRGGLYVYRIESQEVTASEDKKSETAEEPNPKAKLIKVNVGTRSNDQVEILSGLSEGDKIVLRGQDNIHDNADIEVYKAQG